MGLSRVQGLGFRALERRALEICLKGFPQIETAGAFISRIRCKHIGTPRITITTSTCTYSRSDPVILLNAPTTKNHEPVVPKCHRDSDSEPILGSPAPLMEPPQTIPLRTCRILVESLAEYVPFRISNGIVVEPEP